MSTEADDHVWHVKTQRSLLYRWFLRIFRRPVNAFAKAVTSEAYSRSFINSHQMHSICGMIDKRLWPERYEKLAADALYMKQIEAKRLATKKP